MGGGSYSFEDRSIRATSMGYHSKSVHEVTSSNFKQIMNPSGVRFREARDSQEHPYSLPMIFGIDLTGSMYDVPEYLVRNGLPSIMEKLNQSGIKDPQILLVGVGDHECGDKAPLQVGQFESSDELMDKWLTNIWLEGGGGGNDGESYLLAWYFAGFHTKIDSLEKRNQKGVLITIGDEPNLRSIRGSDLKRIMGGGQYNDIYTSGELLKKAKEKYHVFHIHVTDTHRGHDPRAINQWKEVLGDNFIICNDHTTISKIIPDITAKIVKQSTVPQSTYDDDYNGKSDIDAVSDAVNDTVNDTVSDNGKPFTINTDDEEVIY